MQAKERESFKTGQGAEYSHKLIQLAHAYKEKGLTHTPNKSWVLKELIDQACINEFGTCNLNKLKNDSED